MNLDQYSPIERKVLGKYFSDDEPSVSKHDLSPVDTSLICPSADREMAEVVLAIRTDIHERFEFLEELPRVPLMLHVQEHNGRPHPTMRFAARCVNAACSHWSISSCRLGWSVSSVSIAVDRSEDSCPIREKCRWFVENGISACQVCPWLGI
ncbi:MAG: hypothetical protein EBX92_06800 [Actinobacteria bacterium]|nr:hypothetical protein [Actinomycetota bacterium]